MKLELGRIVGCGTASGHGFAVSLSARLVMGRVPHPAYATYAVVKTDSSIFGKNVVPTTCWDER